MTTNRDRSGPIDVETALRDAFEPQQRSVSDARETAGTQRIFLRRMCRGRMHFRIFGWIAWHDRAAEPR